jgi:hypothetical protein
MKSSGNELTLTEIEHLISEAKKQSKGLHDKSLDLYPNDSYKALDSLGVELGQLQVTLASHLQLKKLEVGIVAIDEQVNYLTQRIANLERFYFIATDADSDALENSIIEIRKLLMRLEKERHQLQETKFNLFLEKSMQALVDQLRS